MPSSSNIQIQETRPEVTRPGHVDIWISERHHRAGRSPIPTSWLNTTERLRFQRYIREIDRRRFLNRRGFLRSVLSHYTGVEARRIRIVNQEGGKLWCIDDPTIQFNTTAQGDTFVVAVGQTSLGIDIVHTGSITQPWPIAQRWFTSYERSWLETIEPHRRRVAIALLLSRKEAVLKAMGTGFSISPASIEVAPNRDSEAVSVPTIPGAGWWLTGLKVTEPLIGTLATTTRSPTVSEHTPDDVYQINP